MRNMNKLPYIPQAQESECGLCCVSSILHYFGCEIFPRNIKGYENLGRDGISLQAAGEILSHYNLSIDFYEASYNRLDEILHDPVMLYWENNHFVVLYKITKKHFFVVDPALGKLRLEKEEFIRKYSGFALVAKSNEDFVKIKSNKLNQWKLYLNYAKKNKLRLVSLFFVSILFSLSVLLVPSFIRSLTNYYEVRQSISNNYLYSLIIIIPSFLALYLTRITSMLNTVKSLDLSNYKTIIDKLFSVPFKFYLTRSSSNILFRLGLLRANRDMIIETIFRGVLDGLVAIVLLIAIFLTHFVSFLVMAIFSIVFGLSLAVLRRNIMLKNKLELNEYNRLQSLEYETFSSIFSIKANSQENYMKKLLEKKNKDSMHAYYNRNKISNVYSTITYFTNTFGPIIVLLLSLLFIPEGELSIGTFIFIFTLSSIYFQNFSSIFNTFNTLGTLKNNMIKINDITEQKDNDVYSGEEKLEAIKSIEFKNVFFSYPGQKTYTLKDLSFKISSNEKVGLAGPTGCGKSTILGLIIGIYKPTKGEIYINGINISDINIDDYKQKIGFVPQEPFVYNKSIKDNIIMNRDLEEEMINKSLESSNLIQDITNMPLGLETIISEGGTNISGGQKQRIIIARSIVHNPELLIFDEATSSLDNQTETIITENLKNMTQTQIIVAHRLSTIKDCNKIIFLIDGKIEGSGSYYNLVSNNKKFEEFSK